jgi:hypothetical protein
MFGRILLCIIFSLFFSSASLAVDVNSEVEHYLAYLTTIKDEDREYIKVLTTYAYPEELRDDAVLTASFIIHSLAGISKTGELAVHAPLAKLENGRFVPYQKVPGSQTLWWLDVRDYNWTPEAWEIVAEADGYIVEPVVDHNNNGALRLLSGNSILRMDWFNEWAINPMRQLDRGDKVILHDTLLYAKNTIPKNVNEFRTIWGLPSLEEARRLGNEYLTLVSESRQVARHNRILAGYRTQIGYMYESYDVTHDEGYRNYAEAAISDKGFVGKPPRLSDAGELFSSNTLGMQVYLLRDGAGKVIYDADASVARHVSDVIGDVRVRTGISCMDCHSSGPLPAENTIAEVFEKSELKTYLYDDNDERIFQRAYLDKRFEESIEENQNFFKKNLLKVNGCTPEENGSKLLRITRWYNKPINLEQAAIECGVSKDTFIEKCSKGNFGNTLKLLIHGDKPITRTFWESKGKDGIPGGFQQAMILIKGVTQIEINYDKKLYYKVIQDTDLLKSTNKIGILKKDDLLEPLSGLNQYYYNVKINGKIGWVDKRFVKDVYVE